MRMITTTLILAISAILLPPSTSDAAVIQKVKGRKVYIKLQGMTVKKGQIYKVIAPNGKATGVIKIRKIKGDRAFAVLGKGKARKGSDIKLRKKRKRRRARKQKASPQMTNPNEPSSAWGFLVGFNQTSAEVAANVGKEDLDGNGFSLKAMMDYPLSESLWFRGATGLEQLSIESGTANGCGLNSDQTCDAEIMYLTFDFWGRLTFGSATRFWVGAGVDVMVPVQKDSTALNDDKITNTSVMALGGGMDFMLDGGSYIPIQVEYGIYPKSDTVEATAMAVRIGYASPF